MPAAIAPEKRAAIEADLRGPEQPRNNALARKHHVSPATVSKIAREIGVSFERSITEKASLAVVADAAEAAGKLADRLIAEASLLIDSLHSDYLVFNFGGKDNDYNEHTLDEPPIEAKRQIFTMAAIAIDKVLKVRAETKGSLGDDSAFLQFLRLATPQASDGIDYSAP